MTLSKSGAREMTDIQYTIDKVLDPAIVAALFKDSGIRRPVDDLPRIARMLKNANLTMTAWSGDRLVGIARCVTDFSYCCYLSDLAVAKDFQRRGIGKELVRRLVELLGNEVTLLLHAAPQAVDYYPHIGFKLWENCFQIPRKR